MPPRRSQRVTTYVDSNDPDWLQDEEFDYVSSDDDIEPDFDPEPKTKRQRRAKRDKQAKRTTKKASSSSSDVPLPQPNYLPETRPDKQTRPDAAQFNEDFFKNEFGTPDKIIAIMRFLLTAVIDENDICYPIQQYFFWLLSIIITISSPDFDRSNFDQAAYIHTETALTMMIAHALSLDGKFLINLGDAIRPEHVLLVLKHYAPRSCGFWKCLWGILFCFISRINVCILAFTLVLPRCLVAECGYVWIEDEFKKKLNDMIAIIDSMPIVPDCKNSKSEAYFRNYANEAFRRSAVDGQLKFNLLDFLYFINWQRFIAFGVFKKSSSDDILRVIVASAETRNRWFGEQLMKMTLLTAFIIAGWLAHGQVWMSRFPLFNALVHTLEFLECYNQKFYICYSIVIAKLVEKPLEEVESKLDKTKLAHGFAKRTDEDVAGFDAGNNERITAMWDACFRGGKITKSFASMVAFFTSKSIFPCGRG